MNKVKKNLEVISIFSFILIIIINLIACSDPNNSKFSQVLSNSFENTYEIPYENFEDSGLQKNSTNDNFSFTFGLTSDSGLKDSLIKNIIKTKTQAPVKNGIGKQLSENSTPINITNPTSIDQLSTGVFAQEQNDLTADANGIVNIDVVLTLFKSTTGQTSNTFVWVKQSETLNINLKIVSKINLNNLSNNIRVFCILNDVNSFVFYLISNLNSQKNFENLKQSNIVITKSNTDIFITNEDIKQGFLNIRIVVSQQDPSNFFGQKDPLSVEIIES